MDDKVNMSVSEIVNKEGQKKIYVLFTEGDRSAEFTLPNAELLANKGFDMGELDQLTSYVKESEEEITRMARQVNPMKAFLGDWCTK